jgi:voltage-gated potassium channel
LETAGWSSGALSAGGISTLGVKRLSSKQRVWELVETAEGEDLPSRLIDVFIIALIITNVAVVILDSVPGLLAAYSSELRVFELFSVAVFTVEYLLRLWSCTADPEFRRPVKGRVRFATTPLAVVDFVAIAPFYLPWLLPSGLLVLRVLRLVRLMRLFKVGRYSEAPRLVIRAFRRRRAELLAAVFVLFLLLLSMASLLYLAESPGRPEIYSSIPVTMWWSMLALTGNGQVAPITLAGRLIASAIAIIGVGLFALPAGLLASAFTEELGSQRADSGVGQRDVETSTKRVVLANAEKRHRRSSAEDLAEDYSDSALALTPTGTFRGTSAGREIAHWMRELGEQRL